MERKKIKTAIVFNEPHPELYIKASKAEDQKLDFVPYFEVEETTPMEEYEQMAKLLRKEGINAYTLNIKDDIHNILKDIKKNKPDVIFNFVEIYKEDSRQEMNRSEEHTSELQSRPHLVCRLLLEKKNKR